MSGFQSIVQAVLANGRNHANEICRFDDEIFAGVGDTRLQRHITTKCARAIVEGRISEGAVFGCVQGARDARSPGAYFVAAIKRQFQAVGLPWHTEQWENGRESADDPDRAA